MRRLIKDMAVYGAGDFVFKFVAFAVFPIYAHLFSVEQFGVMALVTTLTSLLSLVMGLGLNNAIQRYYFDPATPEHQRPLLVMTGFWALLAWSLFVTVTALGLLFPFRELIATRYGLPWLLIIVAVAANVPGLIVTYCLDVLRLHFSPLRFTCLSGLRSLGGVLIGLGLIAFLQMDLLGYFLGLLIGALLVTPVGLWMIRKELRWGFVPEIAREVVRFGYPFIFAGMAYWVTGSLDRWMLGELSDNTNVGLYSIAYKVAGVLTFVITAFGQAWSPLVIKLTAEDPDYRTTISRLFSRFLYGLTFIGAGVSLFGKELLRLVTPEAYWSAGPTLAVLAMAIVLLGSTQITALGITLEKKPHLLAIAAWITAIANICLNMWLIPLWGALGAASATLLSYCLMSGLYLYWTQRLHPIPLEIGKLVLSLSIIPAALMMALYFDGQGTGVTTVVAKLSFCGLVLLLGLAAQLIPAARLQALMRKGLS